jgi:hypothetical protein
MVFFIPKIPLWVKFRRALKFGNLVVFWEILGNFSPRFGILCRQKSGNPGGRIRDEREPTGSHLVFISKA